MDLLSVRVPKLGEGIREVRIVAVLVAPQQLVKRDDPFAEVETDKATMVIESPVTGVVQEILCRPGDMLEVGANLAWIRDGQARAAQPEARALGAMDEEPRGDAPLAKTRLRNGMASPRRQQAWRRGAASSSPPDMERLDRETGYIQSTKQRLMAQRLRESHLSTVAASIEIEIDWSTIDEIRRRAKAMVPPSGLEIVAWATAQAMVRHPRFRIRHRAGFEPKQLSQVELAIAVALPDDALTTVRVPEDRDVSSFAAKMRAAIESVQPDRPSEDASVIISDMSSFGVINAVPVVVSPSIATLFIGCPDWKPQRADDGGLLWRRKAKLVLAFDHCLINGAGASSFLGSITEHIGELSE